MITYTIIIQSEYIRFVLMPKYALFTTKQMERETENKSARERIENEELRIFSIDNGFAYSCNLIFIEFFLIVSKYEWIIAMIIENMK